MNNKNKNLLKSFAIIFIALVAIDLSVGTIGDRILDMLPDYAEEIAEENFRLNRLMSDIVILGSSRGKHHYVPSIIKDSVNNYLNTDYSIYNASMDGHYVNSNCCALESIMDRYNPKLVIWDISEGELCAWGGTTDIELASIHYNRNKFVRQYLNALGWKEQIKLASGMFRYNRKSLQIINSFLSKKDSDLGFEPQNGNRLFSQAIMDGTDNANSGANRSFDAFDQYYLSNFYRTVRVAKEKNIKLIIVSSPSFCPGDNNQLLSQICTQQHIIYFDFYNIDYFNSRPELFWDKGHLNGEGAEIFTNMFLKKMKNI